MIPVEGHKNLFRDEKTGAIVNMDTAGYSAYMSNKRRNSDKQAELDEMKMMFDETQRICLCSTLTQFLKN